MNIAVYCSSKFGLDMRYIDLARAVGHWIGDHGHTLVYGGVDAGLMHVVAMACHHSGGRVVGVITRNFASMADDVVDELVTTDDLSQRKSHMYRISDLHVVLPGGLGTIDEWMATLSQWVVDKREGVGMIIANIEGMYDATLLQLRQLASSPFAGQHHLDAMAVATDTEQLLNALNVASPTPPRGAYRN
ncbi:MAG: TIGR00730 family Rossman fold protein [Muribaculaceae bacterium]|nr:TIGR00730 family Rossman fold protein [Muribaculaceae bacterium]